VNQQQLPSEVTEPAGFPVEENIPNREQCANAASFEGVDQNLYKGLFKGFDYNVHQSNSSEKPPEVPSFAPGLD